MDHAVSLVQAYLQFDGYFTSAEYPIMVSAGRNGVRTITDIDMPAGQRPRHELERRPIHQPRFRKWGKK